MSLFGGGAIEPGVGAEETMWPTDDFDDDDDDGDEDGDDLASALVVVALDEGSREGIDALLSPPRANAAAVEVIKWRSGTR